ncbi:YlxQ family RNA-binding protein [Desmospora activa]|uniref:LSU ribosomal protein L7AE n=1 Tax=Desmospora activa DSM 45169 TaxID=1121389 RepID=A0A2T4ZAP6_9BACL|nr:YlxQ family RNA-binding protein [Desmospora activa]PTM58963.1 LSU ribosomal protein L7AE [Desmospora activa DSM 45169]
MSDWLNLLGLAMRAGSVITGEEPVLRTVRSGDVALVILAADAGPNTKKKVSDKCASYRIPLIQISSRQQLGHALGKAERVVIAVTDPGFARTIRDRVSSH